MLIVADSSALIALATCDGLDVILQIYDDIKVPEAVYAEIVAPEKSQSDSLGSFLSGRVMKVDTSRWVLAAGGLGHGELEAMALYKQLSADALLIDDHRARESSLSIIKSIALARSVFCSLQSNVEK